MKQALGWRIIVSVLVLLASLYILLPDMYLGVRALTGSSESSATQEPAMPAFFPSTQVSLGLDLKGGIHLTLGVEMDKALHNFVVRLGQDLMSLSHKDGLLITTPQLVGEDHLECIFTLPEKKGDFDALLDTFFPQLAVLEVKELPNQRYHYTLAVTREAKTKLEDETLDQALKTIRNRIDEFGVAEPDVRKQQDGRISVQLPGMDNVGRAVSVIGRTAHLEFRLVREGVDTTRPAPYGVEYLPFQTKEEAAEEGTAVLAVEKNAVLTGDYVANAMPLYTQDGDPYVSLSFNKRGQELFSQITKENVKKRLAIVLDGKIYSAPTIKMQIVGDASIDGSFTNEQAMDLALVLRAGSLPAPIVVLEERTVGPSLGQEAINMGVSAALIGGLLTMLFMAVYYGKSGLIANAMLFLDVLFVLAGLAVFGATLTLPGIAGIVLTIGMAVDANVLIFERIREEVSNNTPLLEAIDKGFSRAMRAIIDSNLTTIIAAVILYQFGSGPIRGFAVTLTLGIIASMFTAIFVSRIIFDLWITKPDSKLSI